MSRLITFDLSQVDIYEVQAAMLAFIAWPEDEPGSARQAEAQVALVHNMFRTAVVADPELLHKPIALRLVYAFSDANKMITMAGRTYDRLRRSMRAIRILRPFVQQALFGSNAPPLPADLRQLTLNAVTEWVTQRTPNTPDAHAFEHKVVRRLYPVLHLGMALDMILHSVQQATGRALKAEFLMTSEELTRDMISLAEQLESPALSIEQFKVIEEFQVRVRLLG